MLIDNDGYKINSYFNISKYVSDGSQFLQAECNV